MSKLRNRLQNLWIFAVMFYFIGVTTYNIGSYIYHTGYNQGVKDGIDDIHYQLRERLEELREDVISDTLMLNSI